MGKSVKVANPEQFVEPKKYFLFGSAAVGICESSKTPTEAKKALDTKGESFTVFVWEDNSSTPEQLLAAYDGWNGYLEITEAMSNGIKKSKYYQKP